MCIFLAGKLPFRNYRVNERILKFFRPFSLLYLCCAVFIRDLKTFDCISTGTLIQITGFNFLGT